MLAQISPVLCTSELLAGASVAHGDAGGERAPSLMCLNVSGFFVDVGRVRAAADAEVRRIVGERGGRVLRRAA